MDYVQILFALSPFPSYLPQYFTLMQQVTPQADSNDGQILDESATAMDREGDIPLRKRNYLESPGAVMMSPPPSYGVVGLSPGNGVEGKDSKGGLSRATVLLLLSAHLIRLLYFHGILLEERARAVRHEAEDLVFHDALTYSTPTAAVVPSSEEETDSSEVLQLDLLGQRYEIAGVLGG